MRYLAPILAGLLAGTAHAQELKGDTIVLTPEQAAHCRAVTCHVIPADQLQEGLERIIKRAMEAGAASCRRGGA